MPALLSRGEVALYARGWDVHRGVFHLDKIPNRDMAAIVLVAAKKGGHMPVPRGRVLLYRVMSPGGTETLLLKTHN